MVRAEFQDIRIAGIAAAVPTQKEVLADKYRGVFGDGVVRAFSKKTGVTERHTAGEKQTASDLSCVAAEQLIRGGKVSREEVGILVFVTQTPDYRLPATACVLHRRLALSKECMAFDINLGCSGYVYGLQVAASILESIDSRYALLLAGDTMTKTVAPGDRSAAMLFGDAGSATLLEKCRCGERIHSAYRTDGSGFQKIIIPAGGYRNWAGEKERVMWADGNRRSDYDLYMNGVDVFSFTISEVPQMILDFLAELQTDRAAYDAYVFHQANGFILKQLQKSCGLEKEKVLVSMDRYGNTSVASIPLTICDRYGKEEMGKRRLLACGFGVGLSWGILDFCINIGGVFPVTETEEVFEGGGVSHD